jgi:hypothetical protein
MSALALVVRHVHLVLLCTIVVVVPGAGGMLR